MCASIFRAMGSRNAKPDDFRMGDDGEVELPEAMFADALKSVLGAKETVDGEIILTDS